MDFKPVFYTIGLLLCLLSLCMLPPLLLDLVQSNPDWKVFCLSIFITSFFGGSLVLSSAGKIEKPSLKQAFVMTTLCWLAVAFAASLPFYLSELDMTFTDSFFEAMAGITTTSSTVIIALDTAPPGLLLWRALLQWLGGLSLLLMALSVTPYLNIGGMKIFRTAIGAGDQALPRMARLSALITLIYAALTFLCSCAYYWAGMNGFDAIAHAMATISCGGFSTHADSLGYFQNTAIENFSVLFMIMAGTPFVIYIKFLQGDRSLIFRDDQVRFFAFLLFFGSLFLAVSLSVYNSTPPRESLQNAIFNVTTLLTGTGFTSHNYNLWGGAALPLLFFLTASGACAGSASCGIKIFRLQVLFTTMRIQLKRLLYPRGVFKAHYNSKPIPEDVPFAVISFLLVYAICFGISALLLAFLGVDTMTAISGALTALSNAGPGFGEIIGPSGNYYTLPDAAKWVLSATMFLGRLEIIAVIALLHPLFWKS